MRFGFAGIRGVGEGVGEAIIAEREKNGPFATLHDFVDRMDTGQANRRVVEALIKRGRLRLHRIHPHAAHALR